MKTKKTKGKSIKRNMGSFYLAKHTILNFSFREIWPNLNMKVTDNLNNIN